MSDSTLSYYSEDPAVSASAPRIDMFPVQSSQISHLGYDAPLKTLAVRFNGKDDKPGSLYYYRNVDQVLFDEFKDAESVGSFFYKRIKNAPAEFPFNRIVESK